MLESIFKILFGQEIGTTTRTSQNEAFNRIKLVYTSKLINYPVSYQVRHSLAILYNNEGICEIINIVRQTCRIEKHNTDRALVLQNLRKELESFDWDQELVSYGKKTQEQIDSNSLCQVCKFYIDNGLKNQIIDKSYQLKNKIIEIINFETICKSVIEGIFQFSEFRSGQKEAIQSFTQNKDTLILKQMGRGKSLCYALASIIVTEITVVFSPLKALVDDQVFELIKVRISCCVFQEIVYGLIRVIITIPEKFKFNIGFQKMLEHIGNSKEIYFVIDEKKDNKEQFLENILKIINEIEIGKLQKKKDNKEQFLENILKIINEIEIGKCIIYCITIKSCEELFTNLQEKVSKEIINIYHGELSAKEKSNTLSLWKTGNIQIIVVTNAFGMEINELNVQIVIHAGFPISIVQKSGHAGRDRLPAKAIIFFNRKDIKTVIGVYIGGQRQHKSAPLTKTEQQIIRNNVVDVFRQSQAKDIKEKFDNLILRKLVEKDIILNRLSTGQTYTGRMEKNRTEFPIYEFSQIGCPIYAYFCHQ
ncbi:hypothetical protein Glove_280g39 [Diversispora epigaea]|uniref:DNA 3'-5' helicase n=1 Tax=Diversispora epigaea TaxID=1348612 RepID=A0A397I260_9GLOM|nr:hypothetical protein Glove_280g39 [Diversispora epigaea]